MGRPPFQPYIDHARKEEKQKHKYKNILTKYHLPFAIILNLKLNQHKLTFITSEQKRAFFQTASTFSGTIR